MKKSRFSEEQIIGVLKEVEAGLGLGEVCRKHGIYDLPLTPSRNGSKRFISTLGAVNDDVFNVQGSVRWGFKVANGLIDVLTPRVATPSEQQSSIKTKQAAYPSFNIQ